MHPPDPDVLVIIPVLAVVQCVFGVGLLFFGTPLLLLLGVEYIDILYMLLPASCCLSLAQTLCEHRTEAPEVGRLALWVLPAIVLGSMLRLTVLPQVDLRALVAGLLCVSVVLRSSPRTWRLAQAAMARLGRGALAGIALLHGLSNMGGGLLAVYAGSRHQLKQRIHREIATAYALFAGGQLAVLYAVSGLPRPTVSSLYAPVCALLVYLVFGRRAYGWVTDRAYQVAFSAFMLCCAALLGYQSLK
jgi:uncharacterized protein